MKYDKTLNEIILPNLNTIEKLRAQGKGFRPIAKVLGISYQELLNIINTYNSNTIFSIYIKDCKEEEVKKQKEYQIGICRAWASEEGRVKAVEDALFTACFDHNVVYKAFNKKTGYIEEVEQVIPASYNAQRFFLINRAPDRWFNENKEIEKNNDKKITSIEVKFVDPNNEPSQKRVSEMMKEIDQEDSNDKK